MYRSSLLVRLISLDDEETINEGKRRFFAHLREGENLNPDLKSAIYRAAIATGEEEVFNEVLSVSGMRDYRNELGNLISVFLVVRKCWFGGREAPYSSGFGVNKGAAPDEQDPHIQSFTLRPSAPHPVCSP